jgi:hypothetical protein
MLKMERRKMERVTGITSKQANWITKLIFRTLKKRMGRVPKAKTLAAYDTGTLLATTWMDAVCASVKTVPAVLKELVQLKVAVLVGCPY